MLQGVLDLLKLENNLGKFQPRPLVCQQLVGPSVDTPGSLINPRLINSSKYSDHSSLANGCWQGNGPLTRVLVLPVASVNRSFKYLEFF